MGDPLDLDRVHRELLGDLLHAETGIAVGAKPGVRDLHRNCSRTRTSFSKNLRRSGTPCLSMAMRSIPIPKAKPCTRSGSYPLSLTNPNTFGSTIPEPRISIQPVPLQIEQRPSSTS